MTRKPAASTPEPAARAKRARTGRPLSDEERALWETVAKSVRRHHPGGASAPADGPAPQRKAPIKEDASRPMAKRSVRPTGGAEPATRVRRSGAPVDPLGPKTPGLDRRTSRKLSRGEMAPDARIDLHGMTAERAHAALIGFIRNQFADGARCVLVITGKGGRGDQALEGWRSERVGVLKTMAPEWLRQPPIAALVTAVYQAHRRHGGEGALYVYLRKNR